MNVASDMVRSDLTIGELEMRGNFGPGVTLCCWPMQLEGQSFGPVELLS